MPVELGLDTFGDITDGPDGKPLHAAQVIRNLIEEGVLADQVGVDGNLLAEIMTRQTDLIDEEAAADEPLDLEEPFDVVLDEDAPEAMVAMGDATQPPTIDAMAMAMPTNEPTVVSVHMQ